MIKKRTKTKLKTPTKKKTEEEIISEQFHRIQKKYANLISDVVKEIDLIKNWIGGQAISRRNAIKWKTTKR